MKQCIALFRWLRTATMAALVCVTVVAQAQTFFRQEEKRTGGHVTKEEKVEILNRLENTSSLEAEKILISRSPENIMYFEKQKRS